MLCETVNTDVMLTGCQVSEEVWEVSLCIRGAQSLTVCQDPLIHNLGASRHHQFCQGVDVITLMSVSVGESGCIQTAVQVNITSLCYIICNSILHSVKVNYRMYHLKQSFSTFVSKAPRCTHNIWKSHRNSEVRKSKTIQDSHSACFSIKPKAIEREKDLGLIYKTYEKSDLFEN